MHTSYRRVLDCLRASCKGNRKRAMQDFYNCIYSYGTNACGLRHNQFYYINFQIPSPWCNSIHILYPYFQERILRLAADVESNPGPFSDHKDEIWKRYRPAKRNFYRKVDL